MINEEKNRHTCSHIVFVTFVIIFKFILVSLLHVLLVFKIRVFLKRKFQPKSVLKEVVSIIYSIDIELCELCLCNGYFKKYRTHNLLGYTYFNLDDIFFWCLFNKLITLSLKHFIILYLIYYQSRSLLVRCGS